MTCSSPIRAKYSRSTIGHPLPHLGYSAWVMLVSLLVLIPLLLALRGWGDHRLSLLQKCLLLSLLSTC